MSSRKKKQRPAGKKPKGRRNRSNGVVTTMAKHVEPKYLDTLSLANSIGAGATLFPLSLVPQGDSQSTRVGDFIQPLRLLFNYSLYCVNSDIVTTVRLIFFTWTPDTALVIPTVANILQAPSSANVLSHFNFQTQDNFHILWDRQFQASGIPAAPTVNSNFGATGMSVPLRGKREIEFTPANTTGTNQMYLLALSDSSLTPFPILNFAARLYYEDTIKLGRPATMVK